MKVKYFFKGNYFNLQVVSNTCKSLIYGLMVIVLALFDEDTLGELPVSTQPWVQFCVYSSYDFVKHIGLTL